MRTYYITGASGFVGKNFIESLKEEKDILIVAFVFPNEVNLPFLKDERIKLVTGNLLDKSNVYNFISIPGKGDKYVIHIAGRITTLKRGDKLTYDINVNGTKNIVDSMNKIGDFKKLIYISSVDSLPKNMTDGDVFEATRYDEKLVDGVYSKSKAIANNYIIDNCISESTIILPSAIMGPNDPGLAPINNAIKKFLINKLPAITKGGYNIVDIRDVVIGIKSAIEKGRDKESYLISGENISVKDLIELAAKISNKKPVKFMVPNFLIKLISPFIIIKFKISHKVPLFTGFSMDCLKQNSSYNHKKATLEFNFQHRSLYDTMTDTIRWMIESGYLSK